VLIKLDRIWQQYPQVINWWSHVCSRPTLKAIIYDRMT
jgi:hypothetical protein